MNMPANQPGILTLLEAARCNPPLYTLTLTPEFIVRVSDRYFSQSARIDSAFREDLWNMLEGANALFLRVMDDGITAPDFSGAQHALRAIKSTLESANARTPAAFAELGLALDAMLRNSSDERRLELLDKEHLLVELHDGNRVRQLLTEAVTLIDDCLQFTPPATLPERRSWPLRAWCLCVLTFWTNRARLKPTMTKLSEPGGVRIKSPIGKFSEECLTEIGVDAAYDLRSAFEFSKAQLAKDAQLRTMLRSGDLVARADFLANWKDRFPIAIE